MPRKLPPHVERNHVKATHTYHFVAAKDLAFVCLKIPRAKSLWTDQDPKLLQSIRRRAGAIRIGLKNAGDDALARKSGDSAMTVFGAEHL